MRSFNGSSPFLFPLESNRSGRSSVASESPSSSFAAEERVGGRSYLSFIKSPEGRRSRERRSLLSESRSRSRCLRLRWFRRSSEVSGVASESETCNSLLLGASGERAVFASKSKRTRLLDRARGVRSPLSGSFMRSVSSSSARILRYCYDHTPPSSQVAASGKDRRTRIRSRALVIGDGARGRRGRRHGGRTHIVGISPPPLIARRLSARGVARITGVRFTARVRCT